MDVIFPPNAALPNPVKRTPDTAVHAAHLVSRVRGLFALARSRWRLAAFSVARVPPVRRAPCGLASHPAVLGPPSKDLGHRTLMSRCRASAGSVGDCGPVGDP